MAQDKTWSASGLMRRRQDGSSRAYEQPNIQMVQSDLQSQHARQQQAAQKRQLEQKPTQKAQYKVKPPPEDKQDKAHFFENQSKYIPLRLFNQEYGDTYGEQCKNFVSSRKGQPDQSGKPAQQFILKWYKALSLNEKNIALTTVDKELV